MVRKASMESHHRIQWLWPILIVLKILTSTCGLNITSSLSRYYVVRGHSVSLQCKFTLAPEDLGHLEIEWFFRSADIQKDDQLLMWYVGDRIHHQHGSHFSHFSSLDPQDGDASLTLRDVELTDTGTYQCKVKKPPGNKNKIVQLMVMEKISKPVCGIYGDVKVGNKLKLNCSIFQGPHPIEIQWEKITGNRSFPQNRTHFDKIQGDLYIKDFQTTDSGTYRCTAANHVSEEYCDLTLNTTPEKTSFLNNTSAAAVTPTLAINILVVILIIITVILIVIIFGCYIMKSNIKTGDQGDCVNIELKSWIQMDMDTTNTEVKAESKDNSENTFCMAMGTDEEITLKDSSEVLSRCGGLLGKHDILTRTKTVD